MHAQTAQDAPLLSKPVLCASSNMGTSAPRHSAPDAAPELSFAALPTLRSAARGIRSLRANKGSLASRPHTAQTERMSMERSRNLRSHAVMHVPAGRIAGRASRTFAYADACQWSLIAPSFSWATVGPFAFDEPAAILLMLAVPFMLHHKSSASSGRLFACLA